jgi:hypothetical protein
MDSGLKAADEGEGFMELGEEGFFGFEFAGMDTAAETAHFDRMLEVEHLMVEQVFYGVAGA